MGRASKFFFIPGRPPSLLSSLTEMMKERQKPTMKLNFANKMRALNTIPACLKALIVQLKVRQSYCMLLPVKSIQGLGRSYLTLVSLMSRPSRSTLISMLSLRQWKSMSATLHDSGFLTLCAHAHTHTLLHSISVLFWQSSFSSLSSFLDMFRSFPWSWQYDQCR